MVRIGLICVVAILQAGCANFFRRPQIWSEVDQVEYTQRAREIEFPNVANDFDARTVSVAEPRSLADPDDRPLEYWDLKLEDVLRMALRDSKVIRDMGGLVLRAPESMEAIQDPAIQETEPQSGVLHALSAFDPVLFSRLSAENNDRPFNNIFAGGGTRNFAQDFMEVETQISKKTGMGTELTLRNITDYDSNNAPGNAFPSSYTTQIEAEGRQRLLQGASVEFNQIAGPNGVPGINTGIVIARINTDISLTEFELRTRNFLSEVENAYWDLYFAYRDLDAKIRARDAALATWQIVRAAFETGRQGGLNSEEAQARQQYYKLQLEVENALNGRLVDGTRTFNGSAGGTFRGNPGIYVAERRLRYLIGEVATDQRLIRPSDEPITGQIDVNWEEAKAQALSKRVELRRQRWFIKRREAELKASRNYLLPRLDAVGQYRWRGFGKHLFTQGGEQFDGFSSAVENLTQGSFQEWQLGFELSVPFGYRQANSGVRNAELKLARERSIMKEQERAIVHGLSEAVSDLRRSYRMMETAFNRYRSATEQAVYSKEQFELLAVPLNVLLEAQREQASAEGEFYRAMVDYSVAVKNVHFEKGTLLDFNRIFLEEGEDHSVDGAPLNHDFLMHSSPWMGHSVTGFDTQLPPDVEMAVARDERLPVSAEIPVSNSFGHGIGHGTPVDAVPVSSGSGLEHHPESFRTEAPTTDASPRSGGGFGHSAFRDHRSMTERSPSEQVVHEQFPTEQFPTERHSREIRIDQRTSGFGHSEQEPVDYRPFESHSVPRQTTARPTVRRASVMTPGGVEYPSLGPGPAGENSTIRSEANGQFQNAPPAGNRGAFGATDSMNRTPRITPRGAGTMTGP